MWKWVDSVIHCPLTKRFGRLASRASSKVVGIVHDKNRKKIREWNKRIQTFVLQHQHFVTVRNKAASKAMFTEWRALQIGFFFSHQKTHPHILKTRLTHYTVFHLKRSRLAFPWTLHSNENKHEQRTIVCGDLETNSKKRMRRKRFGITRWKEAYKQNQRCNAKSGSDDMLEGILILLLITTIWVRHAK